MATTIQVVVVVLAVAAAGAALWTLALVAIMWIGGLIGIARAIYVPSAVTATFRMPAIAAPTSLQAQFETK
jgi:hypothetical protein